MAAAVNSMVDDGNKITQEVSTTSKNPAEYPLTMVIYAMVPTSGLSHAKADAIARWLRFVAGPAQQEGTAPGTLPTGYLPLTPKLRAETLTAATAVQNQTGDPRRAPAPVPARPVPAHRSRRARPPRCPRRRPRACRSPRSARRSTRSRSATRRPRDFLRYALPGILIIGGLAALGGASSLLAPSSGAIAARLRRYYHTGQLWRKKP